MALTALPCPPRFKVLLDSWTLHLRAEGKSAQTVTSYTTGVRLFARWLDALPADGYPASPAEWADVTKDHCRAWLAALIDAGKATDTRRARHGAIDAFLGWCVDEEEIAKNPMVGLTLPSPGKTPVAALKLEQLKQLIAGFDSREFTGLRDEAITRLFIDSGVRLAELTGITVDDLRLTEGLVRVVGKGGKERIVPFGTATARVLDRYVRRRARHRYAESPRLWVGRTGPLGTGGVYRMIRVRSQAVGLDAIHPHQLRHSFAHAWLEAGGSEGDLMKLCGWDSPAMLRRYGASLAAERARGAHKKLALGDRL